MQGAAGSIRRRSPPPSRLPQRARARDASARRSRGAATRRTDRCSMPTPSSSQRCRAPAKARHRQRIEHLVGENHPVERRRRRTLQPCHAPGEMRHALLERAPLPLAQIGADLENQISARAAGRGTPAAPGCRPPARRCPRRSRGSSRRPAARAPRRTASRGMRRTARETSGAVVKSPPGTELARARAVVAETGRVQRDLHVALETDPASRRPDLAERAARASCAACSSSCSARPAAAHVRRGLKRHGRAHVPAWRTIRYRSDAWRHPRPRSTARWSSSPEAHGAWAPRSSAPCTVPGRACSFIIDPPRRRPRRWRTS